MTTRTRYKFSPLERLEVYYIDLHTLEMQLESQLITEKAEKRHNMKPSRATKYKIAVLTRAIKTLETLVNSKAIRYEEWNFAYLDIQREIDLAEDERSELLREINEIELRIKSANGMNYSQVVLEGAEFAKLSLRAENLKNDIKGYRNALDKHLKKKPEYAVRASKEMLLNRTADKDNADAIVLPSALDSLVRDIESGKTYEALAHFKSSSDTDISAIYDKYDAEGNLIPKEEGDINVP